MNLKKIKKTDRRFEAYPQFKYYLDCGQTGENNFFVLRSWCWNTWGASKSLKDWKWGHLHQPMNFDSCQNSNWCWIDAYDQRRLFFREEEDTILFRLAHGR